MDDDKPRKPRRKIERRGFRNSPANLLSDEIVMNNSMLSQIVRRPNLWRSPVISVYNGEYNSINLQFGCIFIPYTKVTCRIRCTVMIVRISGGWAGPVGFMPPDHFTVPGVIFGMKEPDYSTALLLLKHFHTAPKCYYETPEAMVADGWKV